MQRRKFLKAAGAATIPALLPVGAVFAGDKKQPAPPAPVIKFFGDGEMFEPAAFIDTLKSIPEGAGLARDRYGVGGSVAELEKRFAEITGKEKAMYMPTGTMANQLAIAVLSGENSKVFVQETSHVYRDEADAAQTVFQKRLMPLARNETYFTKLQLQEAVEALPQNEGFTTGIGAVAIENPVRRTDGRMVPIEEIRQISAYCRSKGIRLHLDGARIYIAAAWSGVPVKEYASYFDTVYISLYKYFGAAGGAILCGSKEIIDQMPQLVKVHGGMMYTSWVNAAMALHRLGGFEARIRETKQRAVQLFEGIGKIPGVSIKPLNGGTNIYELVLPDHTDAKKLQEELNAKYNIRIGLPNANHQLLLAVNETLLYQDAAYVINAFAQSMPKV